MARKRIIDPEFWSDQEIGFWSFEGRLFYIGLWNFADDEGRLKAHSALLKAQIFPYELKIDIERLKKEVADKVQWYEVNTSKYGYILNFLKHQRIDRPTASKLPVPPPLGDMSARTLGCVLPNTTKDNISKDKVMLPVFDFEKVWSRYPKKLGKDEAERKFRKQVLTEKDYENLNKSLDNFLLSDICKGDFKYIPYGSTFFNLKWKDWITQPKVEIHKIRKFKAKESCPMCQGTGKMSGGTDCPCTQ